MSYLTLLGQRDHLGDAQDRISRYCCPYMVIEDRSLETPKLEYTFGDDFPRSISVLDATAKELHDFFGHVLRNVY